MKSLRQQNWKDYFYCSTYKDACVTLMPKPDKAITRKLQIYKHSGIFLLFYVWVLLSL